MITPKIEFQDIKINTPTKVGVMIEVTAPEAVKNLAIAARKPRGIVFVVDRSGSMGGGRLDMIKHSITNFLGLFDSNDFLSVVAFDSQVQVVVPTTRIGDLKLAEVRKQIAELDLGGNTDLEAGYRAGIAEAISVPSGIESTLILLSDGHANAGAHDPESLGQLAAAATEHLVKTSSIGIGDSYDERILVAVSNTGRGNHMAALTLDEAVQGLNAEVDGILNRTVSNLRLHISSSFDQTNFEARTSQHVPSLIKVDGVFEIELGDLGSLEERNYVFELGLPADSDIEAHHKLSLQWSYSDLTTGTTVTDGSDFELWLRPAENWVEPARDEDIALELATLRAQDAKEQAIMLMRMGREAEARQLISEAGIDLEIIEQSMVMASERNRVRARRYRDEFSDFADMGSVEFIKRAEESLKRGRESKTDPRKRDQTDDSNQEN